MTVATKSKAAVASALLMLCLYTALGQAPDGPPPGPPPDDAPQGRVERGAGPERQLKMLTHLLNLTTDQQKGVKSVLEEQATEMKALRSKAQADPATDQTPETREAWMTQMKQIREESSTKISALLDDTQKTTFAAWEQKMKAEMERRSAQDGPPDGPPPPDGGGPPPPGE